jgi:uncharacterized membrane-anchored protein YjiN (DUF445 family)
MARMKRIALGLLCAAAVVYALATAFQGRHPAIGYIAAFAEAAMVGAIADWFAVVALFRHPLGLPVPHTAIIPANKDRIGAKLADFICDNFLASPQVLSKLEQFDAAGRLAQALARPANAEKLGGWVVGAARYGLTAFDDQRVRAFLGQLAGAGIAQLDTARLAGQALDALTEDGRHQALLDEVLAQVSQWVEAEAVQEQITEAIAREIRTLRYVGLDQVAARAATRKIVAATANTLAELAADPAHPLRLRFDRFVQLAVARLKHDPVLRERFDAIRAELMAHPLLVDYLNGLWGELLAWLHTDLGRSDSAVRRRIVQMTATLGERLAADEAMRRWINEQMLEAAPLAIERYREDIRRYVAERVAHWDVHEMTDELERHIGRDLQFIRVNGTLVGGLVGLAIHALTQWLK